MAEKMTGGKIGDGSKSNDSGLKSMAPPLIETPISHDKPMEAL